MRLSLVNLKRAWRRVILPLLLTCGVPTVILPAAAAEDEVEGDPIAAALEAFETRPGWRIEAFATEQDHPIANPVALDFDAKGRLWLLCMTSYPMPLPGAPADDRLVILEDTTGDGHADRSSVFADHLATPTGFALGDGGAYVAEQPYLVFHRDASGDGRADERRVLLGGFGTGDSHHAISPLEWTPGGSLVFMEGTFHHTQVETPYGVTRALYGASFRYNLRSGALDVIVSYPYANPWGHVFDEWGRYFIADASGGVNHHADLIRGHVAFPEKHRRRPSFTPNTVRPTSGVEILSSRHFPPEVQGLLLINNVIGMQGTVAHRISESGSSFTAQGEPPVLSSRDPNFRPVAARIGPDGALYIVDWFNPLIGHMQHSLRDPGRDRAHGRVWRLWHPDRPLREVRDLTGMSVDQLFEGLDDGDLRERQRVRRELRERPAPEVFAALARWAFEPERTVRDQLEALWVAQSHGHTDLRLIDRLWGSGVPQARAAALRVACESRRDLRPPLWLWRKGVGDEDPRVRLEALLALSHEDTPEALVTALLALDGDLDEPLTYVLRETFDTLQHHAPSAWGEPHHLGRIPAARAYALEHLHPHYLSRLPLPEEELVDVHRRRGLDDPVPEIPQLSPGHSLYLTHCAACHQPDGQGLPGAYPPVIQTRRILGSAEPLTALILHGVTGELNVLGETYHSEMPAMGELLSDGEIAEILTFIRGSWGNEADAVSEEEVAEIRRRHSSRRAPWTDSDLRSLEEIEEKAGDEQP